MIFGSVFTMHDRLPTQWLWGGRVRGWGIKMEEWDIKNEGERDYLISLLVDCMHGHVLHREHQLLTPVSSRLSHKQPTNKHKPGSRETSNLRVQMTIVMLHAQILNCLNRCFCLSTSDEEKINFPGASGIPLFAHWWMNIFYCQLFKKCMPLRSFYRSLFDSP